MVTPCDRYRWNILPTIRKELALCLIRDYNLTQAETARKLDLSRAAISQYLSGKRGDNGIDEQLRYEIAYSAARITKQGNTIVTDEICRLCTLIRKKENK